MNGRSNYPRRSRAGTFLAALALSSAFATADTLQFFDGSSLRGSFIQIDEDHRVQFRSDAIGDTLTFQTDQISWIRFAGDQAAPQSDDFYPDVAVDFSNGDRVFGRLNEITPENVDLRISETNNLVAPIQNLKSVIRLPEEYQLVYEGPTGIDQWVVNSKTIASSSSAVVGASNWTYKDGAIQATRPSTLGQEFELSNAIDVSFKMSWSGFYSLYVGVFAERPDRYDYRSVSYRLMLSPNYASLRLIKENGGNMDFGRATVTEKEASSEAHVQFQLNRQTNESILLIDGEVVSEWTPPANIPPIVGNSIVFSANSTGSELRLSDIKISTWSGDTLYPFQPADPPESDAIYLVNGDRVEGEILSVDRMNVAIKNPLIDVSAPYDRVTQLWFGNAPSEKPEGENPDLRVYLDGGGRVGIVTQRWDQDRLFGTSPTFKDLSFSRETIRQLQFNPSRHDESHRQVESTDWRPSDE